jgi:KAP family P-loop domain
MPTFVLMLRLPININCEYNEQCLIICRCNMLRLVSDQKYHHSLFIDEPQIGKLVLDFENYVNTICGFILNSPPKFTVGIFGNWGTGKTTLLRNIKANLEDKSCSCVEFDAWEYEQEPAHISVPLILSILITIYSQNRERIDMLQKKQGKNQDLKQRLNQVISGLTLKMTFGVPNIASVDVGYDFSKFSDRRSFNFLNFNNQLQKFRVEQTKLHEGIDLIKELINDDENQIVKGSGQDGQLKLVVFIDDLDRCIPEKATQIFEAIKLFFDIPGIVFVLALSNKIIERAIEIKYKYLEGEFRGYDYLKKIIQLPVTIPIWQPKDILEFLSSLLRDYTDEDFKQIFQSNLELIKEGIESNPREVKRFLNLFILSYQILYDELFRNADKAVNAKRLLALQAVRLRWDWFYDTIFADKSFLKLIKDNLVTEANTEKDKPDIVQRVLREKALVDFLRGKGKVIFDIEESEWPRYRRAEKLVDITKGEESKTEEEEERLTRLINDYTFTELDDDARNRIFDTASKNNALAERLGYSLGTDYNRLDEITQHRLWEFAARNTAFAGGLGSSLGRNVKTLSEEVQNRIWDMAYKNDSFAAKLAHSLGEDFGNLKPDLERRALDLLLQNKYFAEEFAAGLSQNFASLPDHKQVDALNLLLKDKYFAERAGIFLGNEFLNLNEKTRDSVWEAATENKFFAKGLSSSLERNIQTLDKKTQEKFRTVFTSRPS